MQINTTFITSANERQNPMYNIFSFQIPIDIIFRRIYYNSLQSNLRFFFLKNVVQEFV